MKTEAEIRQHISDLAWACRQPCMCRGKDARDWCSTKWAMKYAIREALAWVLDENDGYADHVQELATACQEGIPASCQAGEALAK